MDAITRLRTDQALAEWRCAEAILDAHDGLVVPAIESIRAAVGHGLLASEADLLSDLVRELRREREPRNYLTGIFLQGLRTELGKEA